MKYDIHPRIGSSATPTPSTGHEAFAYSPQPVWSEVDFGAWRVGLRIQNRDGHPVLTELRVYPAESEAPPGEWSEGVTRVPNGGLRPDFVKNIALGTLRDQAIHQLVDPGHPVWDMNGLPPVENWYDIAFDSGIEYGAESDVPVRPGRRPLSEEQLAFVAGCYVKALRDGEKANRYVYNRVREDEHKVTLQAVIGRIHKARKRGFLTKATKSGRREGRLTKKATIVLDHMGVDMNDMKVKEQQ